MKVRRIPTDADAERYRLYAVCTERGDCALEEFLAETEGRNVALLRCMAAAAEKGPHLLPNSRCHLVDKDNKIYEFIGGDLRVLYFSDSNNIIICSHGTLKKTQATKSSDKRRASDARSDYLKAKSGNEIIYKE